MFREATLRGDVFREATPRGDVFREPGKEEGLPISRKEFSGIYPVKWLEVGVLSEEQARGTGYRIWAHQTEYQPTKRSTGEV